MVIDRITFDPAVMGGKPCIRGMRVTVGMVLGLLASGRSRRDSKSLSVSRRRRPQPMPGLRRLANGRTGFTADDDMSLPILIDMNLAPDWVDELAVARLVCRSLLNDWRSQSAGSRDHGLGLGKRRLFR